jgi:hypothetical protein
MSTETAMQNPFKAVNEKAKALVAKLKPTPEGKVKLLNRSGVTLLGGCVAAIGVVILGPASVTIAAGAAAVGMLGAGFGLIQEADNVKHQNWRKSHPVEAPVSLKTEVVPAVEKKADVAPAQPAVEFAAVAEKKAEEPVVTPAAAPAAKPDAPKP